MTTDAEALPPLPEPAITPLVTAWPYKPHFTAEQMHAYARAALAQRQQVPEGFKVVAEVHPNHLLPEPKNEGGHFCREVLLYSGDSPHDWLNGRNTRVKLYALTAAPQAAQAQPQEPPRSAPLTEEQVVMDGLMMTPNSALESCADAFTAGVRFAERAHGISTPKEPGG